jgi:prolyl oligopeptidase PreP (S9A serine peptidase family)
MVFFDLLNFEEVYPMKTRLITFASYAAFAVLLNGCVSAPTASTAPTIIPNANLFVDGIPALPKSIEERVAKYTDFRGFAFVDWHPTTKQMLVSHRTGAVSQLFRITAPGAKPEQLTDFVERVSEAKFEPREAKYIVFERGQGGNEVGQIFRMDLDTKAVTLLSNENERNNMGSWNSAGTALLYSSVPLDRTAQGGTRAQIDTTLRLIDPSNPSSAKEIAKLPGGGWFDFEFSRDDKTIFAIQYKSAEESEIWTINPADGTSKKILPEVSTIRATHYPIGVTADNKRLMFSSDRRGEFSDTFEYDLATKAVTRWGKSATHESSKSMSQNGQRLAQVLNVDGASELKVYDLTSQTEIGMPKFPVSSIGGTYFHRKLDQMAFTLNNGQGPSDIYTADFNTKAIERWTTAYAPPGVDMKSFSSHEVIRWKSFDGLTISGLKVAPPAGKFTGKRPVVIDIHGGPEGQSRVGFMGRFNYLINDLGITIISPNVRGSTGYGKTFLSLDNGYKREDSVKDIGALLDWIATQPDLDASKVVVFGGSYGGYMSLASAVAYNDRLAGAVDVVGISNFVTFLETTESYRRDLRRVEYGDERDPAMRAFLTKISPLTNASKIKKPLFVVQGKNDPRVPFTEAEQIVAAVKKNNIPVWYLRAENEGHGFARKENADFQFYAVVGFLEKVLLGK